MSQKLDLPIPSALRAALGGDPRAGAVGAINLLWNGSEFVVARTVAKSGDVSAVAIGAIATVATPTTGKKARLLGGMISVSAAASVLFEDNAADSANFICRTPKLLADTPFYFWIPDNPKLASAANNVIKATSSAAANMTGTLWWAEE